VKRSDGAKAWSTVLSELAQAVPPAAPSDTLGPGLDLTGRAVSLPLAAWRVAWAVWPASSTWVGPGLYRYLSAVR